MSTNKAVLVSLNISAWDANRQDKRVSGEVAEANQVTDKRLCRLRKSLLPKNKAMDRLAAVMNSARKFTYENTHAWMHDGPRILTTTNFDTFMRQMRIYKADFETAVLDLIAQYADLKEQAKTVLGRLYDELDYPGQESLRGRYAFDIKVQPMPATGGLLELGLEESEAEELRAKLEEDLEATYAKANRKLWAAMYEKVEKLVVRLNDPDAYVHPGTLGAVQEAAELVPRINLTGDTKLDVVAAQLTAALDGVTDTALKDNPAVRARVQSATSTVLRNMQAFMHRSTSDAMLRAA